MIKVIFLFLIVIVGCQQTPQIESLGNSHVAANNEHITGLSEAKTCAGCHAQIYKEWKESVHANSSYFKDPIHQAVVKAYQSFKAKKGKSVDYHCANCHTPMANDIEELMLGKVSLNQNNPSHQEGVSCRSCHNMKAINSHKTFDRPVYAKDSVIYSTGRFIKTAPHPVKKYPLKNSDQMCLSCHAHKHNKKGAGVCVMTGEGGEFKGGSCINCHMPQNKVTGQKSHLFPGSRNRETLERAVELSLEIDQSHLLIQLQNKVSHAFPSSQPMRQAAIVISGLDKKGKINWSNINSLNPKDKTLLMVALESEDGKFPVPPWMAIKRKFDTRLQALEKREMRFDLKKLPKDTENIKVEILYRLLAPKMAKNFDIDLKESRWQSIVFKQLKL